MFIQFSFFFFISFIYLAKHEVSPQRRGESGTAVFGRGGFELLFGPNLSDLIRCLHAL